MRHAGRLAALAVSCCGLAACSPSGGLAANGSAVEAAPPPEVAAAGPDAQPSITVRYWVAGCSVAEDLWKYRKSSTVTCDARGRTLESTRGVMAWPDYLAASDLDTLVVEGVALDGLRFELAWSDDDTFTPERSLAQAASDSSSAGRVRFALDQSAHWQGRVRRFRLTWRGQPSHAARIVAAWGTRRVSPPSS